MIRDELIISLIISVGLSSSLINMHDFILNAHLDMNWTLNKNHSLS